jgi:hypothetical protein
VAWTIFPWEEVSVGQSGKRILLSISDAQMHPLQA